jgi:cytochrome c-type biogenesis protein
MEAPSIIIAFLAGLLSFLSPCVLPLVPAYIGYLGGSAVRSGPARPRPRRPDMVGAAGGPAVGIAGGAPVGTAAMSSTAVADARVIGSGGASVAVERPERPTRPRPGVNPRAVAATRLLVLTHAVIFVLGFTLVFAVIGGIIGSAHDLLLSENPLFHITNRRILQYVMGALLVVFGLHMVGLINIPFLNYERRLGDKMRPGPSLSYVRSFLIGLGFGLGWTPCIGPTLGLIFTLAANGEQGQAVLPFLFYSLGLGVPFMLTALAMGRISSFLKRLTRRSYSLRIGSWTAIDRVNIVSLVSGGLLIFMGIFIFTNLLTLLAPNLPGLWNL